MNESSPSRSNNTIWSIIIRLYTIVESCFSISQAKAEVILKRNNTLVDFLLKEINFGSWNSINVFIISVPHSEKWNHVHLIRKECIPMLMIKPNGDIFMIIDSNLSIWNEVFVKLESYCHSAVVLPDTFDLENCLLSSYI